MMTQDLHENRSPSQNRLDLSKNSIVENGLKTYKFSIEQFDFASEVSRLIKDKGFVSAEVPIERLHEYVSAENQHVDEHLMNEVTRSFYDTSEAFT